MSWWGGAAEPEPVKEPEPVEEEDLGMIGNTWRTTSNGVVYGLTKTKDGFVWVAVGTVETLGDGFAWCGDTCSWMYNGTADWISSNMCGYTTPQQ